MGSTGIFIRKALLYLTAVIIWLVPMSFVYGMWFSMLGERAKDYRGGTTIVLILSATLLVMLSRQFIKDGRQRFFPPAVLKLPGEIDETTTITTMPRGAVAMPDNPNIDNKILHINRGPSFHNTPGGMMNFGPVTVHQSFGPQDAAEDATPNESDIPDAKAVTLEELVESGGKLMGKPISDNTVRNILERAGIESCGEEKRGRARAKVYPRAKAEKAVDDYVRANKMK